MTEYTFTISYWSEATLKITMRYCDEGIEAECRHPMTDEEKFSDIPLSGYWFFFSGPNNVDEPTRYFRGPTYRNVLDQISQSMWEGAAFSFERNVTPDGDAKHYFRQHLYTAFVFGEFTQHWKTQRIDVV